MLESFTAASSAFRAKRLLMRAVMTEQPLGRAVKSERDAAVWANDNITAVIALNKRGVPAPIQKKNALFTLFQTVGQGSVELFANDSIISRVRAAASFRRVWPVAQIDNFDTRKFSSPNPVGQ